MKKIVRRNLVRNFLAATLAVASVGLAPLASANTFPDKPVRIVSWAGPGSAFDTLARMLSEALAQRWNVPVTVENKTGAGGIIGTQYVARSVPDGNTILITTNSAHILNFLLKPNMPFDPRTDFVPVSKLADGQTTLVVAANSPYKTLAEFLAASKESGKGFSYSSFANGSASHLMGEQLSLVSGAPMVHVPYSGGEMAALTDLLGGRLDSSFMSESTAIAQAKAGTIRVLAITGDQRTERSKDVPTFAEQGFGGLDLSGWMGVVMPAGSPPEAVAGWEKAIREIVATPAFRERMENMGFIPVGSSAKEFDAAFQQDFKRWQELIARTGFKPQ